MIKFIATDMDGTLINDNGKINEQIFDLIAKLNNKNIIFAAASGRFYSQLKVNFQKVKNDMIFIAHNGAFIKYNNDGEVLYSKSISKENVQSVLDLKPNLGEILILAGENEPHIVNPSQYIMNIFHKVKVPVVILNSLDEMKEPVYKITYHMPNGVTEEMINYLKKNLNDELEFVVSGREWIDIMNKGTSKGNAIKILQEKFNIDSKNTMVFGDYYNDLSMFKVAHYSYAMGNAPEDVKKGANFVAKTNNEDGVYTVIKEYA
ncbi:HAD family hydrolase [Haloimpatiens massiliensis]|uniref:HAD family hydrolase n=1 Tax=Haloimpatiens massiliensis TaxID=1658110 RepID=UPI000C8175B8|nr:Cof-type HAD-IIB family hydrolase [Haloimpatiens massiliensis]